MDFLTEEDLALSEAGPGRPRRGPERRRQIILRRLVALAVAVLILILVVLGIKGCLNARKERSFQNYYSDMQSLTQQTGQLSTDFFTLLSNPANRSATAFETQVASYADSAGSLYSTLQHISTPGELGSAQAQIEQAYQLRQEGMQGISSNMKLAIEGGAARPKAISEIARYMGYLQASDVLYQRAKADADRVFAEQGIEVDGRQVSLPTSQFLPNDQWLDPSFVAVSLAAAGVNAAPGTHGLALLQTEVKPGNAILSPDTPATVAASPQPEVDVSVQNQGDVTEHDVGILFELSGGPQELRGNATIPRIVPGGTQTAALPIHPAPPPGVALTLTVTVLPVAGESLTTNNTSTYQITFGRG